jgi:hypothetical protein
MKKIILPFFLIGSFAMVYVMGKTGATLTTANTPNGILHLELAYDTAHTNAIIKAWTPTAESPTDNIAVAKNNTYWDFLFMIFYVPFLFLLCRKIAGSFSSGIKKAGNIFGAGVLIAGLLDIGENLGMLHTLAGNQSPTIILFTAICSAIKWLLVILALLYIIIAGVAVLYKKYIRKRV